MEAQNKAGAGDVLTAQQQGMVNIAALTATGNLETLKVQLNTALDAGLTINEIKEALTQLYAYCGFPRSLNAVNTFKTVLEERIAKGITDSIGKAIIVENNTADKYEQGRKVLETLTKTPQPKPAPGFGEFAPRIDAFLKEHLFADIFVCDVLTYQQRELVTIAALAAMTGVEPQLQAHIGMGMNAGVSVEQVNVIFNIIEKTIGRCQAEAARAVLLKMRK
ncbi:carboxymuconolactone decarboxylase family protein [Polluticoccus soli]